MIELVLLRRPIRFAIYRMKSQTTRGIKSYGFIGLMLGWIEIRFSRIHLIKEGGT